jgi:curved DNA-binding protein CbpA
MTDYYDRLGLHPAANEQQIRRAYRDLSRLYHPDTTKLPIATAQQNFQRLNEAYAILSNPAQRRLYDLSIGYVRVAVVQPQLSQPPAPPRSVTEQYERTASAYLDANDRPLSSGELFALFILMVTFVICLGIAIVVGLRQSAIATVDPTAAKSTMTIPSSKEPVRLDKPFQSNRAV